jgi:hypothetical protein
MREHRFKCLDREVAPVARGEGDTQPRTFGCVQRAARLVR